MATETKSTTLGGPEAWDGSFDKWVPWKFSMMNYLRRHAPLEVTALLQASEASVVTITSSTVTSDENKKISAQVMTDLALKTADKARRICMSVAEPDNGFECWRLLCKRGQGGGAALKVGLLNQI